MSSSYKDWPSVTRVLSPWNNFSNVHPDILEQACLRGTITHSYVEKIIKGQLTAELALMFVPNEYKGYVESFLKWHDLVDEVLMCEKELVCFKNRFIGHPDLVCRMKNGTLTVIDFKTAKAKSKVWRLQLRAYNYLVETELGNPPDRSGTLRLSPKGKTPIFDYYDNSYTDLAIFFSALNVWRYINQ